MGSAKKKEKRLYFYDTKNKEYVSFSESLLEVRPFMKRGLKEVTKTEYMNRGKEVKNDTKTEGK